MVCNLLHLISICIISTTFPTNFLRSWQGEFVEISIASLFGDYFLFSHDFYVWFKGDIVRKHKMLVKKCLLVSGWYFINLNGSYQYFHVNVSLLKCQSQAVTDDFLKSPQGNLTIQEKETIVLCWWGVLKITLLYQMTWWSELVMVKFLKLTFRVLDLHQRKKWNCVWCTIYVEKN